MSPQLAINLVSLGQLVENNYNVSFSSSGCVLQDQELGEVIARGPKRGRLFSPLVSTFIENKSLHQFCFFLQNNSWLWHNRLRHLNASTMSTLFKYGLLNKPIHSAFF